MMINHLTVKTKFKDLVAQQAYSKKWGELSTTQQNELRSKHRQQFYILSRKAREKVSDRNDHDLLIRIDERTKTFEHRMDDYNTKIDNHLRHHFRYNILAWSIAGGAIVTLAIALIKVL